MFRFRLLASGAVDMALSFLTVIGAICVFLALTGCAEWSSTHTSVTTTAVASIALPDGRVVQLPPVDYRSNKEQDWLLKVGADGSLEMRIRAPNSPGMTADEMTSVIQATGATTTNAFSKLLGVFLTGTVPVKMPTGPVPFIQVPVTPVAPEED